MTIANNTSLCSNILVLFLEFIPVNQDEVSHIKTTEFVPVSEPAWLPGLYEKALSLICHDTEWLPILPGKDCTHDKSAEQKKKSAKN